MPKRLFVLLLIPALFTACTSNNVTVDDSLKRYFDSAGVSGDFGLFDNGAGHFTIYNLPRFRDSAFAPGSTFNVISALVALQTGALTNDTSVVFRSYGSFEDRIDSAIARAKRVDTTGKVGANHNLQEVFKGNMGELGVMQLAHVAGKDSIKKWVDSLRYGNRDVSEIVDSNWVTDRLKITSDEQLGLMKKLYFDQLPFFQRTQQLVRQLFEMERNSNYLIAYTTARTTTRDGKVRGWIMGWEEENKHPYFFVCNFESTNPGMDVSAVGLQLVKKILAPMGFFAGKK